MKICVLIVTYNRKQYLENLLKKIVKQTYKIDSIFIFDNNSSDGTDIIMKNYLKCDSIIDNSIFEHKKDNINFMYYRCDSNTGGAGGFSKSIEILYNMKKFDYIWMMDDDVLPENDCLENLFKFQSKKMMITIPNRTDDNYNDIAVVGIDMKNPFKYFMKRKKIINACDIDKECVRVFDMAFEGPLINIKLIDKIGFPDPSYFIQFDDSDYAIRSSEYTEIGFVKNAILHKEIVPPKNNKKKPIMNWKDYYAFRNDIVFCKKYGKNIFVRNFTPVLCYINIIIRAIIKRKWKNIKVMSLAFKDGINNRIGKTIEPGKL